MSFYRITEALFLEVVGPHAVRYLNSRLTNNIKTLAVGSLIEAAALSPQGKVEGVFSVLRTSEERFLMIADGGDRSAVAAAVKRYIVADRVEVRDISEQLSLVHLCGQESIAALAVGHPEPGLILSSASLQLFSKKRTALAGADVYGPREEITRMIASKHSVLGEELTAERYLQLRIQANVPSFPEELNEQTLLVEAEVSHFLSSTKGCYVGQEVIEKVSARGKPPRKLIRLKIDANARPGDDVVILEHERSEKIGQLVSVTAHDSDTTSIAFALVRNRDYSPSDAIKVGSASALIF